MGNYQPNKYTIFLYNLQNDTQLKNVYDTISVLFIDLLLSHVVLAALLNMSSWILLNTGMFAHSRDTFRTQQKTFMDPLQKYSGHPNR